MKSESIFLTNGNFLQLKMSLSINACPLTISLLKTTEPSQRDLGVECLLKSIEQLQVWKSDRKSIEVLSMLFIMLHCQYFVNETQLWYNLSLSLFLRCGYFS